MDSPLVLRAVIANSRRDTSGQASKLNREELLETVSNSHFEGSGGGRIQVTDDVRVSPSQDDTWSEAEQNARAND